MLAKYMMYAQHVAATHPLMPKRGIKSAHSVIFTAAGKARIAAKKVRLRLNWIKQAPKYPPSKNTDAITMPNA